MHLYCRCLNVTLNLIDRFEDPELLKQFLRSDLMSTIDSSVEWVCGSVATNDFAQIKWHSLNKTLTIRDMTISRCLVCQEHTHISSTESSRILFNKKLLNEQTVNEALRNENYSPIAKIVLPTTVNRPDSIRFSTDQDEFYRREQEIIQNAYRQALVDAERESDEKIRSFQREQEQILEKQSQLLNRQLDLVLSLIQCANRYSTTNKISPLLHNSSSYIHENSMESGFGSDIFDNNANDWSRQSSNVERSQSERNSNPDDDSVLENFDIPNYSTKPLNFATSLPKDIAFRPMSIVPQDNDSNDLERIAKSFRELSQSLMCTDGTELFGDLPSPRLNLRAT